MLVNMGQAGDVFAEPESQDRVDDLSGTLRIARGASPGIPDRCQENS